MNTLKHIKEEYDNLEQKTKEELVEAIRVLLINDKRKESKILSLQNERKYYERQLKKIKEMIDKVIKNKDGQEHVWSSRR